MKRFLGWFVLPTCLLLGVVIAPLVRGESTLCLRDVLNSHMALKAYGAEALRRGELPLVDPLRGGGQPYLGNLNAFPLYPSNLLFLFGTTLWALNAHFWLHWVLAPWGMFALARRWGLERAPAWAAGVLFAFSGYFVSQLNMANLVGGVTLAPALVAATLSVGEPHCRRRGVMALGVLWALELLAGDPVVAVIAAVAALSAAAARSGVRAGWGWIGAALGCGTLLALPQLVELSRILEVSYRGFWGYQDHLVGGWNPRLLPEWLVPFLFGRPDQLLFWGQRFAGEGQPLFFVLFPGVLAYPLVAAAGAPRERSTRWAVGLVVGGLLFASAAVNPLMRWIFDLPGGGLFRYPVKFWLLLALGASLLAGVGAERLLAGRGRRAAAITLAALVAIYAGFWLALLGAFGRPSQGLAAFAPEQLGEALLESEQARWAGLGFLLLLTCLASLAALAWLARRGASGLALLLALHVASQLLFLTPALPTDATEPYREPPPLARELPPGAVVVDGNTRDQFSAADLVAAKLPGRHVVWLERRAYGALAPWAGQLHGYRYELDPSPEGLGQFMTQALALGMKNFGDVRRLRVLRALGVELLLIDRDLAPETGDLAALAARVGVFSSEVRVYRVADPLPNVALLGEVVAAPHMNAALEAVFDPRFDPRRIAVVAGEDGARRGPSGEARLLREEADELEIEASSAAGGLLVVRRTYLPIYQATVDGKPAPLRVGNLTRLAVELPAGKHIVRIVANRRPLRLALAAAALGLVALFALARAARPAIIRATAGNPLSA